MQPTEASPETPPAPPAPPPPPQFPADWAARKVVLAHDWLTGMRGGERVLELLCQGFPDAPLLTLVHRPPAVSEAINAHSVRASFLQRLPAAHRLYRHALPLYPLAVRGLHVPPADLLLTTSHSAIKALRPPPGAKHLCYCFTPMRYLWTHFDDYFAGRPLTGSAMRLLAPGFRRWDRRSARRVDRFVAISETVRERIRRCYDRDAGLVYPPADTGFFTPRIGIRQEFDLIVSALVPYKRIGLAVDAYRKLGLPLKIVGTGSGLHELRRRAGPRTEFLGRRTDEEIRDLYRTCRLLVFPGEEDFGLVPVEAQACGTPVVAFEAGGVRESVKEGVTGLFFPEPTADSLADTVIQAAGRVWDPRVLRAQAEKFNVQAFLDGLDREIRGLDAR